MVNIEIKYNPYIKSTKIIINDELVNDKLNIEEGSELSDWINPVVNNIYGIYNESAYKLKFTGIERDFDNVKAAFDNLKTKNSIEVKYEEINISKPEDRFTKLKQLFEELQKETPYKQLKTKEIRDLFEASVTAEYEMAVVATISCGKSTFINSILGKNLLPEGQEATTAVLAQIMDNKNLDTFNSTSYGYDKSKKELKVLNTKNNPTNEDILEMNNNPNTEIIKIEGNLSNIHTQNLKLVLTDSPGPNNSENKLHGDHTYALLKADYKPLVIFVLEPEKYQSTDNDFLLSEISEKMNDGTQQSKDRFIFVLNKLDDWDIEKEGRIERLIDRVKKHLETYNIKNPKIFPCSSLMAKILRLSINGYEEQISKDDYKKYLRNLYEDFIEDDEDGLNREKYFINYCPVESVKNELLKQLEEYKQEEDNNNIALIYSGIPAIEKYMELYIEKYAIPEKISHGINSFNNKLKALELEAKELDSKKNNEVELDLLAKAYENLEIKLKQGTEAEKKLIKDIETFTVKKEIETEINKAGTKVASVVSRFINANQGERKINDAELKIASFKNNIKQVMEAYKAETSKVMNDILKHQIEVSINKYKEYLNGLLNSINYSASLKNVFSEETSISIEAEVNNYKQEKIEYYTVYVPHTEKVDTFGTKLINILTFGLKDDAFQKEVTMDKKETRRNVYDVVNFKSMEPELMKCVGEFTDYVTTSSEEWLNKQEDDFKDYFINKKIPELKQLMKQKANESKKNLKNQKEKERLIEENEKRLQWIKSFTEKMNSLMSI
ncbi:MAG: dynamin family protein [Spirochaetales bacterium]|nr:dynamin family protein [Spirochaetales bacterium]